MNTNTPNKTQRDATSEPIYLAATFLKANQSVNAKRLTQEISHSLAHSAGEHYEHTTYLDDIPPKKQARKDESI